MCAYYCGALVFGKVVELRAMEHGRVDLQDEGTLDNMWQKCSRTWERGGLREVSGILLPNVVRLRMQTISSDISFTHAAFTCPSTHTQVLVSIHHMTPSSPPGKCRTKHLQYVQMK